MTTINFYSYNGHPNTVNKQLGDFTAIEGDLRQTFDVLRPTVTLRKQPRPTFNYCYIPDLGRYYFVDRVSFEGNNSYELALRIDVLKTYESEILAATGRVSESDNPDPYISNRDTVYRRTPNFEKVPFANTGLLNETGGIIMVTLKGNENDTEPTGPTVTNNITDSTEQHTYQDGTLSITVTASEGYTFQDAKESYHTSAGTAKETPLTVEGNKATIQITDLDVNTPVVISGEVEIPEPVTPTVTNNIDGTEESHEWDGETLTITVKTPSYISARLDKPQVHYTNTGGEPITQNMQVQSTSTRVTATAVITDLGGDYSVTVTGTYIRTLPLTKSLTNCTSKEPLPNYVDFDSLITVELDANPNTEFHTDETTYLSVRTRIGGHETKTPFTISSDKKKATISYQLANSGNYNRVNIVGECFPVEVVGKQYGSINVYLVTLDNLKEFAAKRYFTGGGENVDLGEYVNRIKRIYTDITPFSTDVIRCGNYNTGVSCHQPAQDKITLDFGTAVVPAHNEDNTDYESEIQIFLPFAGFVNLNTDYAGKTIALQYVINVVTGNGVALLSCNGVVFQVEETEPSSEIIYLSPSTQVKTLGGDDWNEMLYYGLEPYIYCKWYESASNGRNNNRQTGILGDFRGFNVFDDVTPIHTAEMLTEEQEMIYTALSDGVYIE